jgi:hypothetical protein
MNGNSEGPNGVVIAVFCMSLGWTEIWLYALTISILERTNNRRAGEGRRRYDGRDSGRVSCVR